MSVPIVVDEWLFSDLSGENSQDKQQEALEFLCKLYQICDRIVILEGSPFERKIRNFIKISARDPLLRGISQFLNTSILTNSKKILRLIESEVSPLPEYLEKIIPLDDQYLFRTYLKLRNHGCFILTTDGRWNHKLLQKKSIKIKMRDDFLKKYGKQ